MLKQTKKTLLLLDTHGLIHRAYHALPKFRSKGGEPTGALYGLSTMLIRALKELKPYYVVAAYDLPGPTFRHTAYEEYKAHRPKADDELIDQLKRAHDITKSFGIPECSAAGFEADDILGTIVEKTKKQKDLSVVIVSGDVDTFQLVDGDRVVVYTMRKGLEDTVLYDEKKVVERFGFSPEHLPDYKGLRGDTSDNIVGVPGVGEKTGSELIKHFGSLENMYKAIERKGFVPPNFLTPRILELLKTHKKNAFFSKALATIRKDAPVDFVLPKACFQVDRGSLSRIFVELGFNSLLQRIELQGQLFGESAETYAVSDSKRSALNTTELALEISTKNEKQFWDDIDKRDEIFLVRDGEMFMVLGEKKSWRFDEKFLDSAQKQWAKILKNNTIVSDDIKNLIKIARYHKLPVPQKTFDCLVASWVAESTLKDATLQEAALRFLGSDTGDGVEDRLRLLPKLSVVLRTELKKRDVEDVFFKIESPLIGLLAKMEELGVEIDRPFLSGFKKEISAKRQGLENRIYRAAGTSFNINSPQQVSDVLFGKLGVRSAKVKKTGGGRVSTRESELVKLKGEHEVVSLILEHRELAKILTTYVEPLLGLSSGGERIHTTFNQTGTVTGRLSSDSPNLQNIPIRSELGARVRNAFVASKGFTLAAFDYSQIELRILASLADDEKMISAFKGGIDIHRMTAAEINNVSVDRVTPQMRMAAKTINFGIIYGMGVRQLAASTGMGAQDAQRFYNEYFLDFPSVRQYIDKVKKEVYENGYVATLYGRRRYFDLKAITGNRFLGAEMERMAVNAIIQGTDADIMKRAMIAVDNAFDHEIVRPLLQIHDEMIYEIRDKDTADTAPNIKSCMERASSMRVPLRVDTKTGKRWGELEPFGAE